MKKIIFGNENFNLENFGWRTFDPGRDLEIEILEDENFHENGRTIIFYSESSSASFCSFHL
jgi:hypothetical protein